MQIILGSLHIYEDCLGWIAVANSPLWQFPNFYLVVVNNFCLYREWDILSFWLQTCAIVCRQTLPSLWRLKNQKLSMSSQPDKYTFTGHVILIHNYLFKIYNGRFTNTQHVTSHLQYYVAVILQFLLELKYKWQT